MTKKIISRRLSPKLRMVANGSATVNTLRSELAAAVAVQANVKLDDVPEMRGARAQSVRRRDFPKKVKRGTLKAPPKGVETNVFIELENSACELPTKLKKYETGRRENLVAAKLPVDMLQDCMDAPGVTAIELGETVTFDPPVASEDGDPPGKSDRAVLERALHHEGEGVLVGIVDVGGFDFAHPDFLDNRGKTRWHAIWDQGAEIGPSPEPFNYGRLITRSKLNAAITEAKRPGSLPAWQLEPQSQMSKGSHATHVASIAAGNRGVAGRSVIAGVLISLTVGDLDRRKSFYDSTRIANAIDWLFSVGKQLGMPVSINISLGTNGYAHDGTSATSRWLDYALVKPSRCVTVAAGNAGQEKPLRPGDHGFVMGRIHTSGVIDSAGLSHDLEWNVVGDTISDVSENELEVWYEPQDRFAIEVLPPGAHEWIGPVEPGEFIENQELEDGMFISIYNELYNSTNGANTIAVYLSPFLSTSGIVGVTGGQWTVRLTGRDIRDGRYHAWIERDDPRRVGSPILGFWRFPSFFGERTNVDDSSVSSLACGHRVASVANLDADANRINITSSQGPTRDGRQKPDVCAPGTGISAAKGFAGPNDLWVEKTGTSMAAPFVTGVAALMLATQPKLTAAQILGIIRRTAQPVPGTNYAWKNDAGFGRIDPEGCVREAKHIQDREDLTP